jgi:hypothetical protein
MNTAMYTASLRHSAIKLKDEEEKIIWSKKKASGMYTATLGYEAKAVESEEGERKWW